MKRFLTILLVLSAVLIMTACADRNTDPTIMQTMPAQIHHPSHPTESEAQQPSVLEETILGTWMGKSEMAEAVNAVLDDSNPVLVNFLTVDSFQIHWVLEFREDGTMICQAEEKSLERALSALYSAWISGYTRFVEYQIEGTETTFEEFVLQFGITAENMADEMIDAVMKNINADALYLKCGYQLEGDQLTVDAYDGIVTVALSGSQLEFICYNGAEKADYQLRMNNVVYTRKA